MKIEIKIKNDIGEPVYSEYTSIENYNDFCKNFVKNGFQAIEDWKQNAIENGECPECNAPIRIEVDNVGYNDNPKDEFHFYCTNCDWSE